jgi:hypothetical protein
VARARLVLVKYGAVMAQVGLAVLWVAVVGLIAGTVAFGMGELPTLSGTTLGPPRVSFGSRSRLRTSCSG